MTLTGLAMTLHVLGAFAIAVTMPRVVRRYRIPVNTAGHVLLLTGLVALWPGAVAVGMAAQTVRRLKRGR